MKHLRALTMFDHIPAGCILQPVANDDSAPHIRAGEFAVIDTLAPTASLVLPLGPSASSAKACSARCGKPACRRSTTW
jgi:hypothetical protein